MGAPGDSEWELLDGLEPSSLSGRRLSWSGLGSWLGVSQDRPHGRGLGRGWEGTPLVSAEGSELGFKMERGYRLSRSRAPVLGRIPKRLCLSVSSRGAAGAK